MKHTVITRCLRPAALWLCATVAPASCGWAQTVETSDVTLGALATYDRRADPQVSDAGNAVAPFGTPASVNVLALGAGGAHPGFPGSQTQAFASAALDNSGNFGVGVSGFFLNSNLPPDSLVAAGTFSVGFTNNTAAPAQVAFDFFVPPPVINIAGQGVGDFFPPGADPRRDVSARVNVAIVTTLTRADGSVVDDLILDYGMQVVRDPVTGVQLAVGTGDALGLVERFDISIGEREFQLPGLTMTDVLLPVFGPGDRFEFRYDFFAAASTGFGETALYAAIGDPFDLSVGGPQLTVGLVPQVPEPGTWALFAAGLAGLAGTRAAAARHRIRSSTREGHDGSRLG